MNQEIVEKIQKLLALANSENEHEAKLAASKAQELLVKYNLSIGQVRAADFQYEEKGIEVGQRLERHQVYISQVLKDYFFVEIVLRQEREKDGLTPLYDSAGRRKYKKTLDIIGTKENVMIAGYIYDFLNMTYPKCWKEFNSRQPGGHKISYYRGLTEGVMAVLKASRFKVETEMGLVVVGDPKLKAMIKARVNGTHRTPCSGHHAESHDAGVQDGQNIKLRKPLTSDSSQSGKYIGVKS